jgi:hypothetical protein
MMSCGYGKLKEDFRNATLNFHGHGQSSLNFRIHSRIQGLPLYVLNIFLPLLQNRISTIFFYEMPSIRTI